MYLDVDTVTQTKTGALVLQPASAAIAPDARGGPGRQCSPGEHGLSGIVSCKVDASYGPISIGGLLVASSTRGHAMPVRDAAGGWILGKAMIRVLVSLR
jgi:hypothetical protein